MKRETVEWLQKAEGDYQVANREAKAESPVYDAVCFHAQQCIEKYLKAWLVENERNFPRTHDLIVLFDLCKDIVTELKPHRASLAFLTAFAVAFRYPGEAAMSEDAHEALQMMETIRALMRWRLGVESKPNTAKKEE